MLTPVESRTIDDNFLQVKADYSRLYRRSDGISFEDFAHDKLLLGPIKTRAYLARHGDDREEAARILSEDLHSQTHSALNVKIIDGVDGPTARLVKL